MTLLPPSRLLAFVVPTERRGDGGGVRGLIHRRLSAALPSYSVPDALVLVPALPLTAHGEPRPPLTPLERRGGRGSRSSVLTGKVDVDALVTSYQRQRAPSADVGTLEQTVHFLWQVDELMSEKARRRP